VIAIGGIDAARLDDVAKTGAAGFAGVGMFM
jgi:thiamine monophosphate synthase